jgi:hypothetical protein
MWIYQHVAGDVHEFFSDVLSASEQLARMTDNTLEPVHGAFAKLTRCMRTLPATLVPYAQASAQERDVTSAAYLATLDLAVWLERIGGIDSHDRRIADATCAVLDFMEEWQPYISRENAALNLVRLDGLDMAEALAVIDRDASAATQPIAELDEDCPLCAMLARCESQ